MRESRSGHRSSLRAQTARRPLRHPRAASQRQSGRVVRYISDEDPARRYRNAFGGHGPPASGIFLASEKARDRAGTKRSNPPDSAGSPLSKNSLAEDFRTIRTDVFPKDTRTI